MPLHSDNENCNVIKGSREFVFRSQRPRHRDPGAFQAGINRNGGVASDLRRLSDNLKVEIHFVLSPTSKAYIEVPRVLHTGGKRKCGKPIAQDTLHSTCVSHAHFRFAFREKAHVLKVLHPLALSGLPDSRFECFLELSLTRRKASVPTFL